MVALGVKRMRTTASLFRWKRKTKCTCPFARMSRGKSGGLLLPLVWSRSCADRLTSFNRRPNALRGAITLNMVMWMGLRASVMWSPCHIMCRSRHVRGGPKRTSGWGGSAGTATRARTRHLDLHNLLCFIGTTLHMHTLIFISDLFQSKPITAWTQRHPSLKSRLANAADINIVIDPKCRQLRLVIRTIRMDVKSCTTSKCRNSVRLQCQNIRYTVKWHSTQDTRRMKIWSSWLLTFVKG